MAYASCTAESGGRHTVGCDFHSMGGDDKRQHNYHVEHFYGSLPTDLPRSGCRGRVNVSFATGGYRPGGE